MTQTAEVRRRFTAEDYLRFDDATPGRHELRDGELLAMSGETVNHSLIIANTIKVVGVKVDGKPCRVFDSNLRVRLAQSVRYGYPDLTVICGPVTIDPLDKTGATAVNPRIVVEVLSRLTERSDRGEKFRHYIGIESLDEYVMVSQHVPRVETFLRQSDGTWSLAFYEGLDATAKMRSLAIELPLTAIYEGVEFPPPLSDDEMFGPEVEE